jgi:hypothetical protein
MSPESVNSRVSNCRRVEEFEGDLDAAFHRDGMADLLRRLVYSKDDQNRARAARHGIPIAGNLYNGTATLRAAVNLYREFRSGATRRIDIPKLPRNVVVQKPRPFEASSTRQLLNTFSDVLEELRQRKIMRTANNPVADYAEFLVAKALDLTLLENSTAGHDAVDDSGKRFEIKSRRIRPGATSVQLSALRGLDARKFDVLAAVLFSDRFEVERACLIPFDVVKARAAYVAHVNAWNLILRPSLWNATGVEDFTEIVRRAVSA